jgi:ABC-type sugar transport system permease subunit
MKRDSMRDQVPAFAFLFPALVFFAVFIVYPFVDGLMISLSAWDGFSPSVFVGLRNYEELFQPGGPFLKSLGNNSVFAAYTVVGKNVLALFIALLLNGKIGGRGLYRTMLFLPTCLSFVAVGLIWGFIYNPSFGIINAFLSLFGKARSISWLGDPRLALASVSFVDIWKWTGYHVVLYLAGLQTIASELYESAAVDGASPVRTLVSITIPELAPVIVVNVVISLMGAYGVFDVVYIMTRGGPYNSTQTLLTNMYEVTFHQYQIGLGSAIVVLLFVIVMLITLLQNRIGRRLEA